MKRPVVYICLSLVLGILIAGYLNWIYSCVMISTLLIGYCFQRKKVSFIYLIILISFFCFGVFNTVRQEWPIKAIHQLMDFNEPIEALGTIQKVSYKSDRYQLTCLLSTITQSDQQINTKVKAIVYIKSDEPLRIEDTIHLQGKIQLFKKPTNPGGFDAFNYYRSQKTYLCIYTDQVEVIKNHEGIRKGFGDLRDSLEKRIHQIFPLTEAGIMNTLLLGSTDEIDSSTKKLYQVSGISHLLAISGLHVSVIGMGLFQLLKKWIKKEKTCAGIACCVLWAYCFLSGMSTSALRATLMITLMLFTYFFGEKYDIFTSLFLSGLLILCMNPHQLMEVGFLLSFCAVGGIIYVTPKLESQYNKNKNGLLSLLLITLGASLVTYPILVNFFYQVSVYSLLVNLLVVPTSSVLIGFGILALLSSLVSITLGNFLAGLVYFALKYIEMICTSVNFLPFHTLYIKKPIVFTIILYYVVLFLWLNLKKIRAAKLFMLGILAVFLLGIFWNEVSHHSELKITFLDVGQGDSSVIEYRNKVFLIDGGGDIQSKSEFNKGHYVVLPFLASQGVNHIDTIFISHSDFDHIYGIIEVVQEIPTDSIIISQPYELEQDELLLELLQIAEDQHIKIDYMSAGDRFYSHDLRLDCEYPESNTVYYSNNNDKSMVLKLQYKDFSVLFTGDIEATGEATIDALETLRSDVIKVPHHGSNTSSTDRFVDAVNPQVAIFSYGQYNLFGHPSQEVVARYADHKVADYHIANEGAVILLTKGKTFTVEGFSSKRKEKYPCNN